MRTLFKAAVVMALAAVLAGCIGSPNEQEPSLQFSMEQTTFALKQWNADGSHQTTAHGKLLLGDRPVANADLRVGKSKRELTTSEDGSFEFLLDQSLLGQTLITVSSLERATAGGKSIAMEKVNYENIFAALQVQVPIVIRSAQVSPGDSGTMVVQGRVVTEQSGAAPFFKLDKYQIAGTLKDADGKLVKGAVVWIDRDRGEGFAKSTPSDDNGHYEMYYLPEEDEETNLTVTIGTDIKYTLPSGKVYHFPDETSVTLNITLPRQGTVIDDTPPNLVSQTAPGALYLGMLVGLEVPGGTDYTVTLPDAAGNFTLTVPKNVWEQQPAFFETNMTKFVKDELKPGDPIPSSFLTISPDAARIVLVQQFKK